MNANFCKDAVRRGASSIAFLTLALGLIGIGTMRAVAHDIQCPPEGTTSEFEIRVSSSGDNVTRCVNATQKITEEDKRLTGFNARGQTLLALWIRASAERRALVLKLSAWRKETAKYEARIDVDTSGTAEYDLRGGVRDDEVLRPRLRYLQLAAQSAMLNCEEAVVDFIDAAKIETGNLEYTGTLNLEASGVARRKTCAAQPSKAVKPNR